jgi:hypothetical protein
MSIVGTIWRRDGADETVMVLEVDETHVCFSDVDSRGVSPWGTSRSWAEFVARYSPRSHPTNPGRSD